jgi:hypothetical protein
MSVREGIIQILVYVLLFPVLSDSVTAQKKFGLMPKTELELMNEQVRMSFLLTLSPQAG